MALGRLIVVAAVCSLLAAMSLAPLGASGTPIAHAAKGKKCRKGYVPKTIHKKGKKVTVCRKKKGKGAQPPVCRTALATPSCATPPQPLFEPPGRKLEGEEAKPFLQKYLVNSTFTDCPAGWPNCAVEERYSHTGESFFYCRISGTGADIINGARAYEVKNAVVEPDGSWAFNEVVDNYGNPSFYEWHVSTTGLVTGVYQYSGTEQVGPLQYVAGARDCSY